MIGCGVFAILLFCASTVLAEKIGDIKKDYNAEYDSMYRSIPPSWCEAVECGGIGTGCKYLKKIYTESPIITKPQTIYLEPLKNLKEFL